ncbi:hypothetical protein TNCV_1707801 [Trichonephila clavipes]|uniref:Uncharacterized protein n=1 Tax=Trichonephila clavipes TaxID=2585209 RepID=A0A8X6V461_TRICX|nr:hypothetical protein TNCV_1707801 [Trichonephila clavipes]
MGVCKCIVPLRLGGTLNSRRVASPLVRLVEGEERLQSTTGVHLALAMMNFAGLDRPCDHSRDHLGAVVSLGLVVKSFGSIVVEVPDTRLVCLEFEPVQQKTRRVEEAYARLSRLRRLPVGVMWKLGAWVSALSSPPGGATAYQLLHNSISLQVANMIAKNDVNLALSPTFHYVSIE